ncbi:hypothetical protein O6P43_019809 [Quillaja saponaria]|uniref:Uncharacterized protein n=1 Tax=Quillaja saponaria TaxID=32244 RepID=A0AAD7LJA1_QUISA|nr:hypothetical protein O6P43_019809 [Quillaja saponaria]
MAAELNSGGEPFPTKKEEKRVPAEAEPWLKPKNGSVFPAKRKSVKTMMFQFIADAFMKMVRPKNASNSNKCNSVCPHSQ